MAIIGGTDSFGVFLARSDIFHLTRVAIVTLPGGRPVFPGVPSQTPETLLIAAGLVAGAPQPLDAERGVSVVTWQRSATTRNRVGQ